MRRASAWTDGGGQVGYDASCACVIETSDGRVFKMAKRLPAGSTNNIAEYQGVILAIEYAMELGVRRLDIHSDSRLIVEQIRGFYKTRNPHLKSLLETVHDLAENFDSISIKWIPRAENRKADKLCREVLKVPAPAGFIAQ